MVQTSNSFKGYSREYIIDELNSIKGKLEEVYDKMAEKNFSMSEVAQVEVTIDELDSYIGDLK